MRNPVPLGTTRPTCGPAVAAHRCHPRAPQDGTADRPCIDRTRLCPWPSADDRGSRGNPWPRPRAASACPRDIRRRRDCRSARSCAGVDRCAPLLHRCRMRSILRSNRSRRSSCPDIPLRAPHPMRPLHMRKARVARPKGQNRMKDTTMSAIQAGRPQSSIRFTI